MQILQNFQICSLSKFRYGFRLCGLNYIGFPQITESIAALIVLLDINIFVGKQLLLSEIAFLHHSLQHLQSESVQWPDEIRNLVIFCRFIINTLIKKQTMLVILRTVACVASSLTRANSTVCPPWATSMPQYLRKNFRMSNQLGEGR